MLEIIVLAALIGLAFLATLAWGFINYRRDRKREVGMDEIAAQLKGRPIADVVRRLGDPFEVAEGTSGRSMYVWKAPPATTLPQGSGLLTVMLTIESGKVVDVEWRDHVL